MEDVRKAAEERAAREKKSPVGAGFESERQREKNALVRQLDAQDGRNVRKIAAATMAQEEDRILRVAAYCRVSTDDIDQKLSIHLQIQQYMKRIKENPNWKYAGCYVDDGFSGTNTAHRQGFQKLMKDAMDGKIDMIITKAVSRFARNLMDCIGWVEALQNHDPPVRVFFEQENLDTMSQTSGIILFVLAMVAQEESHMKSEAILLSLEWRFSRGRFLTPRLFGYNKVEVPDGFGGKKKILAINETEARVVRWMYGTLVNGGTPEEIADVLTEMAIPTGGRRRDGTLNTHWTASGVVSIMRNEKHCGDVLARKTYTPNYKDHKAKKNNGKKNKYFQPDHHDAIVSRAIWNAAQRILNSRRYGHEGTYLPMRIIDHGALTGYISMNRAWAGFDFEDYYRAAQIVMGLLDEDLTVDLGSEYLPEAGRRIGGLVDDHGIAQIARDLTAAEQEIKDELEGKEADEAEAIDKEEAARSFQVVSGDMFSRVFDCNNADSYAKLISAERDLLQYQGVGFEQKLETCISESIQIAEERKKLIEALPDNMDDLGACEGSLSVSKGPAVVSETKKKLSQFKKEENDWGKKNIALVEVKLSQLSASDCANWLERTKVLPKFLGVEARTAHQKLKVEIENRLRTYKIEGVVSMFNALNYEERKACLKRLIEISNL